MTYADYPAKTKSSRQANKC